MKALRLLAVVLSLASAAFAQTPSTDSLLQALESSLKQPSKALDPDAAGRTQPYVAALRNALAAHDYAESGRLLAALKGTPLGSADPTGGIIDQLQTNVRAEVAAAATARDAEIDAVISDVRAKFSKRAPAAAFDPILARLAKLGAATNAYNDQSRGKLESVRMFVMRWQDYLLQSSQGNLEQAANGLNMLMEIAGQQGIVPRSELAALQAENQAKAAAARVSRGDAATARVQALTKSVQAATEAAKTPADLDALLAEINKPLTDDPNNRGNLPGNAPLQIESMRRFVLKWQDYLAQLEAGNGQAATNILRELSYDNGASTFIPRSRLLALLNGKAPGKVAPVASEPLVTPDELTPETLDRLVLQLNARNDRTSVTGMEDLAVEASRLRAAYAQLKLGNPYPAFTVGSSSAGMGRFGPYAFALARVQQTLVVRALPAYVEAPAGLTPSDNETPTAYLLRLVQRGQQAKDWQLVYRALKAAQSLNQRFGFGSDRVSLDVAGYQLFFQAMNEERAGLWMGAVRSYLSALRTSGPDLPAEEIGDRLAQLKNAHPQEYEAAQRLPTYPEMMPAMYGGAVIPNVYRSGPAGMPPGVMAGPPPTPVEPAAVEPPPAGKAPEGTGPALAKPPAATPAAPATSK